MSAITRKDQVLLIVLLAVGILAGMAAPRLIDAGRRLVVGVAPGVELQGYPVGRLYSHEVKVVIEKLAEQLDQRPIDAYYDSAQKKVVPETVGRTIDPERTLEAVLAAESQTQVAAIFEPVYPPITHVYFQPVYRGDLSKKAMALMINVAWGNEYIPSILEVLAKHHVKATFFFIGTWVERFPKLFDTIVKAGHEIANHGYVHGDPTQMNAEEIAQLIIKAHTAMEKAGATPVKIFAPPAGEYDQKVVRVAAGLGFRTVLWTLDTVDWKRPAPEVIVERVVKKAQNGALVLMHPTEPTLAALPWIIEQLTKQGYKLVTVSELL